MVLLMLLGLSVVMALSCFLAGALPLSMNLSSSQLRLISTIGMGVLVGTSLIVIIPEGIESMYSAGSASTHARRTIQLRGVGIAVQWAPTAMVQRDNPDRQTWIESPEILHMAPQIAARMADEAHAEPEVPPLDQNKELKPETGNDGGAPGPHGEEEHEREPPTFYIGLSLITGFILMFLIDKVPRYASESLQTPSQPRHISLGNLSQGLHSTTSLSDGLESESFLQSLTPSPRVTRSLATTTGLVIHAFADGIAMGATASSSNTQLGFIIFLAIMIHKAPAAFGLTSVLLKQGLSKRAARGHLIIFSLASPFGALSTYLLVGILGGNHMEGEKGQWWTGMLLLFSAGTFLYVAMHAMQEDASHHEHPSSNGYTDENGQKKAPKSQMRDTIAAVGGMLIPLLTQLGHHH